MNGNIMFEFFLVAVSCFWIMKACDPFEEAADYLGRNMKAGMKGATINAVASSMPEFLTTVIFLFFYHNKAGFAAGIGTTAGSAVFNAMLIPAFSILAVFIFIKGAKFNLSKACIVRDGVFLITAELVLIVILGNSHLTWYHGASLVGIYACYMVFMLWQNKVLGVEEMGGEDDDEEGDEENNHAWYVNFVRFDYRNMLHRNCEFNNFSAIVAIIIAVLHISGACYLLAESVIRIATFFNVNTFFVAVILAAAATSVPDTIISFKDAMKGNHDDAVANAVGSNIFDITICLGLPLLVYSLMFGTIEIPQSVGVAELRIILLILSVMVIGLLLLPKINFTTAMTMISMYLFYATYTISRAKEVPWAAQLGNFITKTAGYN